MNRVFRTRPCVVSSSLLLATFLLLIAALIPAVAARSGYAPGGVPSSPLSDRLPDSRSVLLTVANPTVAAGTGVLFLLNVTPLRCVGAAPPNETVATVVFHAGDGFAFEESPRQGPTTFPGCDQAPDSVTVFFEYAYRSPAIEHVTASVTWSDGFNLSSNVVVVTVTSPSSTIVTLLQV